MEPSAEIESPTRWLCNKNPVFAAQSNRSNGILAEVEPASEQVTALYEARGDAARQEKKGW